MIKMAVIGAWVEAPTTALMATRAYAPGPAVTAGNMLWRILPMKLITFSRQLGSGGGEIAAQVAEKLNYTLHDTESIDNAAREMGFLDSVEEIDEKKPSFFEDRKNLVELVGLRR